MTEKSKNETLLVCNCQRTMEIDAAKLGAGLRLGSTPAVQRELCRAEIGAFETALAAGGKIHIACTQEAELFREVAEERAAGEVSLRFTNIRESAGWCQETSAAVPKMAALIAAASYESRPAPVLTLKSDGQCLIYGAGQQVLDVAADLGSRLSVSILFNDVSDAIPPAVVAAPIAKGRIRTVKGHLGAFEIGVDGYAAVLPSSRNALEFTMPRDGAKSRCDLILDLSGGKPLFSDPHRREGYFHADPRNPAAVARAMFQISDMVGEFEKPIYVAYHADICAHARSQKIGCTNCLDNCPTGAIAPAGDHVAIDAAICGGCGNCASVCPTGAASYAFPRREDLIARADVLIHSYLEAGGVHPVVLVHDEKHGSALIGAMARFGRGLPANVLPLSLYSTLQLGHEAFAAMLVAGAEHVMVLGPPEQPAELASLEAQTALANAFLAGLGYQAPRVHILAERDPDVVEEFLYGLEAISGLRPRAVSIPGTKRDISRSVLALLHEDAPKQHDIIALPQGAPYGRIFVDEAGCTLCLSCVGACPANALADNPDRPELSFTEAACVQCGICVATCPEKVIKLEPRYNFTSRALSPTVLKGEEPFNCVKCGKPFGTRSTIEQVVARLRGHSMFPNEAQLALIQMCDTCRVVTLAESGNDPFAKGERPRVRTTDDYLSADAEAKRMGKKPEDFLS